MRTLQLLVPGDPATLTGGYGYARRIVEALPAHGVQATIGRLDDSFPFPTPDALVHAYQRLESLDDDSVVVIDGLALGAMPDVAHAQAHRLRLVALVHHPLALETGLDAQSARRLADSERRALEVMQRVIVTSASTQATLQQDYYVAPQRLRVVEPGTDRGPVAHGGGQDLSLLCVATVTPRKGHDVLIDALAETRAAHWSLRCVGSLTRSPQTTRALLSRIAAHALNHKVELVGELDSDVLGDHYRRSDAFVIASRHEGYGMALAEALAHGLPVIGTRAGAIPDTVPADAGLLVDVDDVHALGDALTRFMNDAGARERLRAGALAARERLRDWHQAAGELVGALDGVLPNR